LVDTLQFTSYQPLGLANLVQPEIVDSVTITSAGEDGVFSVGETVSIAGANIIPGAYQYVGVTTLGNPVFFSPPINGYVIPINGVEPGPAVNYTATNYAIPCFLRGTLIATEEGEIPVEDLAIGTRVKTVDGCFKPVTWVGKRSYLRLFTPLNRRNAVMPIRIAAGALADGVPARDLHVSPKHALLLDGHLIAPELLVNGTTIARMDIERVDYFHVKLEAHDVIFAEGTPAETYVVHGNLKSFNNWQEHEAIFGPVENDPASVDYAPRLRKGEALDRIRETIAARAAALGHGIAKAG